MSNLFSQIAIGFSRLAGHDFAFTLAARAILVWLTSGPIRESRR